MPIASYRRIAGSFSARTNRQTVGHTLEEEPAEVGEAARPVSAPAHLGVDPDLLQLHRVGRPRRRLGLEEDDAVLDPQPRALVLDLAARTPAEPVGVALHRVDADLLLVRGRAGGHEDVEVAQERGPQAGVARRAARRG